MSRIKTTILPMNNEWEDNSIYSSPLRELILGGLLRAMDGNVEKIELVI